MTAAFGDDDGASVVIDGLVARLNEQDVSGAAKLFDILIVIADTILIADVMDRDRLGLFGFAVVRFLGAARDHSVLGPLIEVEYAARLTEIARKITEATNG